MRFETKEHGVTVSFDLQAGEPTTLRVKIRNAFKRRMPRLRYALIARLVGDDVCVINGTFKLAEPFDTVGSSGALVVGNTFIQSGWKAGQ